MTAPGVQEGPTSAAMDATAKYIADKFFDQSHLNSIHQSLSSSWDRLQSLSAAIKLMEKYGVVLTPEEEERISKMEEEQQIEAMVAKMPQDKGNDQFQKFFLQLQVLVATAGKVRQALEQGKSDVVEQVLDAADGSGISPYVLRMGVVQAGSEVALLKQQMTSWSKDMDSKMSKKIRGFEDAMNAQKRLRKAQAELQVFTEGQNEKSKKVMTNFMNNSDKGLVTAAFKGWSQATSTDKQEREIASEYLERIDRAEGLVVEYQVQSKLGVMKMLEKKGAAKDAALIAEAFEVWKTEVEDSKFESSSKEHMQALEERVNSLKATQVERSRRVMARMNGDQAESLRFMAWGAWRSFHDDYQKNKEMEDAVKEAEAKVQEYMKNKKESARKVLTASMGNTDVGLLQVALRGWKEAWEEAKAEAALQEVMQAADNKFSAFGSRGRVAGMNAMDRATYYLEQMLLIRTWNAWRLDTKMEATLRFYHQKIEAKRQQLVGVQQMFRTFANELESGLKKGGDSTRETSDRRHRGMSKTENTVSLPDIHQQKSSGRKQPAKPSQTQDISRSRQAAAYPAAYPAQQGGGPPVAPEGASPPMPGHPRQAWQG